MSDLLPCPFCGGDAERVDIEGIIEAPNFGGSCISCTSCAASSAVHFDRKENLASSWNDRATITAEHIIGRLMAIREGDAWAGVRPSTMEAIYDVIRAALSTRATPSAEQKVGLLERAEAALNGLIWRANHTMYETPSPAMQEAIDAAAASLLEIRAALPAPPATHTRG